MLSKRLLAKFTVVVSFAALTTNAFAEGKTRAEVRQELIDAQNNGLNFVTDASYPDVSPVYQHQVERLKAMHSGSGPATAGSSDAGQKAENSTQSAPARDTGNQAHGADTQMNDGHAANDCVGPPGFCNPYFGS